MALTASQILEAAKDFPGIGTELFPTQAALRALARFEREVYAAVLDINPGALAVDLSFSASEITTALDNGTALTVPDHFVILSGRLRFADYPDTPDRPFWIIPTAERGERLHIHPSGYIIGQSLYLRQVNPADTNGGEWEDADTLVIQYVPIPTAPTAVGSSLTVPEVAENYLVHAVADYLLRVSGQGGFPEIVSQEKAQLIGVFANQADSTVWQVRTTC